MLAGLRSKDAGRPTKQRCSYLQGARAPCRGTCRALCCMRVTAFSSAVARRTCFTGRATTLISGWMPIGSPSFLPSAMTGLPFQPPLCQMSKAINGCRKSKRDRF